MFKIGTCLLLALSAWSQWEGSLAEHLQSGHVCLIDEPHPNQCESFCLNALRPILIETKSKLNELEGQQVKMEERLRNQHQAAQNKIEGKLQAVQSKVEEVQGKLMDQPQTDQTKVDEVQDNLLAVETMLRHQHQADANKKKGKLHAIQSKVEEVHGKMEDQHHALQTKVDEVQAKLERNLLAVQYRLEANLGEQNRIQVKLERNLIAIQSRVEGQQTVLTKIENQLQTIINNIKPKVLPCEIIRARNHYNRLADKSPV